MSDWCYVKSEFLIDKLNTDEENIEDIIGKQVIHPHWYIEQLRNQDFSYEDIFNDQEYIRLENEYIDECDNMCDNPLEYLPHGSEGTLNYELMKKDNSDYILIVDGNLRDVNNPREINGWFRRVCTDPKWELKQAKCSVNVSCLYESELKYPDDFIKSPLI